MSRVVRGRAAARVGVVIALVCLSVQPAHAAVYTSAADVAVGSEVRAVATKVDQSLGAQVAFVVTDGTGRQASCT